MSETKPSNVVPLDPQANAVALQLVAARADISKQLIEAVSVELGNFKLEVRASLQINANMVAEAISKLEHAEGQLSRISERLVNRLSALEQGHVRNNSADEIVISLAEQNLAERKLELQGEQQAFDRKKQEDAFAIERDRNSLIAKAQEKQAVLDEKKAVSERRWLVVKQWSTALTSTTVILALIALVAKAC